MPSCFACVLVCVRSALERQHHVALRGHRVDLLHRFVSYSNSKHSHASLVSSTASHVGAAARHGVAGAHGLAASAPARGRRSGTPGTCGPPTGRAGSTVPWGRTRSTRAGGSTRLKARTRSHAPPAPRQPTPAVHGQGHPRTWSVPAAAGTPSAPSPGGAGRLNLCSALTQRKCSRLACASPRGSRCRCRCRTASPWAWEPRARRGTACPPRASRCGGG